MNPKIGGICGCLSGLERSEEYPTDSHPCPECGEVTLPGQALCVFCTSKHNQPQSYPPSIVPSATGTPRPESMQFLTRAEHDETIGKRPKPPSIVPAAVDEMKSAIMDSMMLTLTNIVEQADALIVQLARLKGAIK